MVFVAGVGGLVVGGGEVGGKGKHNELRSRFFFFSLVNSSSSFCTHHLVVLVDCDSIVNCRFILIHNWLVVVIIVVWLVNGN